MSVALARQERRSFARERDGGLELYTPVVTGATVSVVRARVPAELLDAGVRTAWLALAGVAVVLVAVAAVIADRLARSVTRDATELSGTRPGAGGRSRGRPGHARPDAGPGGRGAGPQRAGRPHRRAAGGGAGARRRPVPPPADPAHGPAARRRGRGAASLVADVERLEAAVSELIRSARRPLHPGMVAAACDLSAVARDRAGFWSALADDDGPAWAVEVGDGTGPVPVAMSADEAAAVDALVGNVFDHTPEGTPYTLWVGAAAGVAHLVVEDAGPGIEAPEAVVGRGATRAGSTGLGLDIVRQAAEAAGGRIEVGRSALGGARVALVVPLAASRER
jgi:signal transduction histidine kinase